MTIKADSSSKRRKVVIYISNDKYFTIIKSYEYGINRMSNVVVKLFKNIHLFIHF